MLSNWNFNSWGVFVEKTLLPPILPLILEKKNQGRILFFWFTLQVIWYVVNCTYFLYKVEKILKRSLALISSQLHFPWISNWPQRYTYRVLQTIQMQIKLLCVWAEWAILGSVKTAFYYKRPLDFYDEPCEFLKPHVS